MLFASKNGANRIVQLCALNHFAWDFSFRGKAEFFFTNMETGK